MLWVGQECTFRGLVAAKAAARPSADQCSNWGWLHYPDSPIMQLQFEELLNNSLATAPRVPL